MRKYCHQTNATPSVPYLSTSSGLGRGRLVPSSHNGIEFRYTVVRQFSRGDERIREVIPVPESLGKATFLTGVFASTGNPKGH